MTVEQELISLCNRLIQAVDSRNAGNESCCTDKCKTCEPEVLFAHSAARFNDQVADNAIQSQRAFQERMNNTGLIGQKLLANTLGLKPVDG